MTPAQITRKHAKYAELILRNRITAPELARWRANSTKNVIETIMFILAEKTCREVQIRRGEGREGTSLLQNYSPALFHSFLSFTFALI